MSSLCSLPARTPDSPRRGQTGRRPSRWLALLGAAGLLALPALVSGQTPAPPPRQGILQPYGTVDVRTLPPVEATVPGGASRPFLVPRPDVYRQKKLDLERERLGDLERRRRAEPRVESPVPQVSPRTPSVITSFFGLRRAETGGFVPPDTQIAAGPSHLFEAVNAVGRILTKAGAVVTTFDLRTFFGVNCPLTAPDCLVDPRVRFDPRSGRWFVAAFETQADHGNWRLAVSATSDPTGAYFQYFFFRFNSIPDFPNIGISDDQVVLTADGFVCLAACTDPDDVNFAPEGATFIVINKAQLLAGVGVNFVFFDPPQALNTIQPAHSLSSTPTLFMASERGGLSLGYSVTSGGQTVTGVLTFTFEAPFPPDTQDEVLGLYRLIGDTGGLITTFTPPGQTDTAVMAGPPGYQLIFTVNGVPIGQPGSGQLAFSVNGDNVAGGPSGGFVTFIRATNGALFTGNVTLGALTSTLRVYSVNGVPGVGAGPTVTTVDRAIARLAMPAPATQMGTAAPIATNDQRLLDGVFRDGSFWLAANTGCVPAGDVVRRSCLRFIEVRTDALAVAQDFNFGTSGIDHYYPAIQTDGAGTLITVFSRSSASEFASVYASGRLASDAPNTLQAPVLIKAGEAPYDPALVGLDRRWGDYSGAGLDPSDATTIWVAGEYARVEGGGEWGTWIAQVRKLPPPVFLGGVYVAAGDVNGDGRADIITGPGAGGGPHVRVFSGAAPAIQLANFFAYDPAFAGGIRIAAGDVNGDGRADLITGPGPGGGPHVRVFSGTALPALVELAGFFAYDPAFAGGIFVAAGDVNGDNKADLIIGADAGGGPHVRVFSSAALPALVELAGFFAYAPAFTGGVRVAAGDVDGDNKADLITAAGPGGGPHVRVFSGAALPALVELAGFFAYAPAFTGGVFVAAGNLIGGTAAEVVTGADRGGGPHVRVFTGAGADAGIGFFAYSPSFPGGVRVAVGNLDGLASGEIVTTPGPTGGPHVRAFSGTGAPTATSFLAY